ncbi:MAG: alpha-N-acetylglucosaminidase C-terminal domain-containing protein, partial [Alphaproteobacteria bacterium]
DWLDPRTDLFSRIAALFYQKQRELFGDTTMYKMDLLHEGGQRGTIPVAAAADSVRDALLKAHPNAVWVLLGWENNPPQDIVRELGVDQALMVDGLSDQYATAKVRESDWLSRPYTFGMINNYGARSTMGANGSTWLSRFYGLLDKQGNALSGIAYLPEAGGTDAAAFELFTDLAWHERSFDLDDWFGTYSTYRYGGFDEHASNAWKIIGDTAYSLDLQHTKLHDSLFGARPSLDGKSNWGAAFVRYDADEFAKALPELLETAPELRATSAYRHDLVNVTRQVLSNRSRVLLPKIKAAFDARDVSRFKTLAEIWLDYMRDLDALLATDPGFLLGNFLAGARAAAGTDSEIAQLQYDQRSLLTTWGDKKGLEDYANREVSGLVGSLYKERWQAYFDSLTEALNSGASPKTIDWFALEDAWARKKEDLPTEANGDAYALAKAIVDKIALEPN